MSFDEEESLDGLSRSLSAMVALDEYFHNSECDALPPVFYCNSEQKFDYRIAKENGSQGSCLHLINSISQMVLKARGANERKRNLTPL